MSSTMLSSKGGLAQRVVWDSGVLRWVSWGDRTQPASPDAAEHETATRLLRRIGRPLRSDSRQGPFFWKIGFFRQFAGKYTLSLLAVIREGLQGVVFIAGVSFAGPATAVPLRVVVGDHRCHMRILTTCSNLARRAEFNKLYQRVQRSRLITIQAIERA